MSKLEIARNANLSLETQKEHFNVTSVTICTVINEREFRPNLMMLYAEAVRRKAFSGFVFTAG